MMNSKDKFMWLSRKYFLIDMAAQTYENWRQDRTLRLGAGLAYYGMFALVPIATLMIGVAAYFYSLSDIQVYVNDVFSQIIGSVFSSNLDGLNEKTADAVNNGFLSGLGLVGIASLFISASFIFVAMQDALDVIWKNPIRLGWRKWIKRYLVAYLIVLLASSLLFIMLVLSSAASIAEYLVPGELPMLESIADVFMSMGSWVVGIFILALISKLLIYRKVSWPVLILGSTITSMLIVVGTWALSVYLTNFAGKSLSGAVGAVLLILIWIYYEAQIILVGAQLTRVIHLNKKRIPILNWKIFNK